MFRFSDFLATAATVLQKPLSFTMGTVEGCQVENDTDYAQLVKKITIARELYSREHGRLATRLYLDTGSKGFLESLCEFESPGYRCTFSNMEVFHVKQNSEHIFVA